MSAMSRPTTGGKKELVVLAPRVRQEHDDEEEDDEAEGKDEEDEPERWQATSTCTEFLRLLESSNGAGSLE
jgi:TATA-binding protein-associated factor Taf7